MPGPLTRLRAATAPRRSDVGVLAVATALFAGVTAMALTPLPGWTSILVLLFLPAWIWAAFRAGRYVRWRRTRLWLVIAIALAIPLANRLILGPGRIDRGDIAWAVIGLPNAVVFGWATWRALRLHRR